MFRETMPRLFELRELIEDPSSPDAYFADFELQLRDPLANEIFLGRERELQLLDVASWDALKSEARPYLTARDRDGRGWSQLVDILNQARAHNHLVSRGCSDVAFVPREENPTPDLEATLSGQKILCEVKTINISDEAVKHQVEQAAGSTRADVNVGLLSKLTKTLDYAKKQMLAYDDRAECIAFITINFDDWSGQYKANYYAQIDQHLESEPINGIQIVFYNGRTPFHAQITMRNAFVINETGWSAPEAQ